MTGSVRIDLSREPETGETLDRRRLDVLRECPDGARVVVDIGRRHYVSQDAAYWIHEHDTRLLIEIRGENPRGVAELVRAAREGEWSAIA